MKKPNLNILRLSALASVCALGLAGSARAADYTVSTSAPTPGANDITNVGTVDTSGYTPGSGNINDLGNFYSDSNIPGETFTTGSNTQGYDLKSITFEIGDIGSTTNSSVPPDLTLDLYTFDGGIPSQIGTGTVFTSGGTTLADKDYITFTVASGTTLLPGSEYGFGLQSDGSFYIQPDGDYSTSSYDGGSAYNFLPGQGPALNGSDILFDVGLDLAGTPEPSTYALLLAGGVFLFPLLFRRLRVARN